MDAVNTNLKIAPPSKASKILAALGYPLNDKLLRKWAKDGTIPATWTGRKWLISINGTIRVLESGHALRREETAPAVRQVSE